MSFINFHTSISDMYMNYNKKTHIRMKITFNNDNNISYHTTVMSFNMFNECHTYNPFLHIPLIFQNLLVDFTIFLISNIRYYHNIHYSKTARVLINSNHISYHTAIKFWSDCQAPMSST